MKRMNDATALSRRIEKMDREHVEIAAAIESLEEVRDEEELLNLVDFLDCYVRNHFEAEERLMAESRYPDLGQHAAAHRGFVSRLRALGADVGQRGMAAFSEAVIAELRLWLAVHVQEVDAKMREHVVSSFGYGHSGFAVK